MSDDVERWIADMFSGHAVAIRRQDDPPIPGEPFMSMAAAKDICRAALTASRSSNDEIVEGVREVLTGLSDGLGALIKAKDGPDRLVIDGEYYEGPVVDAYFDFARAVRQLALNLLSKVKEQG